MKTLNLGKVKKEFLMITAFHGTKFLSDLEKLEIDESIKEGFRNLVNDFMKDLFEIADFDPLKEKDNEFNKTIKAASKSVNHDPIGI
jgi:hypothetical protein